MGNRLTAVRRKQSEGEQVKKNINGSVKGPEGASAAPKSRRSEVTLAVDIQDENSSPFQQESRDGGSTSTSPLTNEGYVDGTGNSPQQANLTIEPEIDSDRDCNARVGTVDAEGTLRSLQQPSPSQTTVGRDIELRIALHSQATQELDLHTLPCLPPNVLALKQHIQSTHCVPQCCQSVVFDSIPLGDSDKLPLHYMRSGDIIDIHFQSEADTKFISAVLDSLNRIVTYVDSVGPYLCQASAVQKHISIQQIQYVEDTSTQYFHCTLNERSHANFFFFCENGGPELLRRLHTQLLAHSWKNLPDELKLLESVTLLVCWDITELSVACSRLAICQPLQNIIVQTAVGNRTQKCPMCIFSRAPILFSLDEDKQLLKDTKFKASSALTNIIESIPSCRVQIASSEAAMTELVHQTVPSNDALPLDYEISLITLTAFMCLAYSPATHKYLATQQVMEGIMTAPTKQHETNREFCRYVASLCLAMVVVNPSARRDIPAAQLATISAFIAEFLSTTDPAKVHEFETERGLYWVTMLPHMRVAYAPLLPIAQCNEVTHQEETKALLLCVKTAILSLRIMNLNPENRHILGNEGLLDYLQCLPWYLPAESEAQQRTLQLTRDLGHMLTQPPTLVNIARARLATMHFGLDSVLFRHIHELGAELYAAPI